MFDLEASSRVEEKLKRSRFVKTSSVFCWCATPLSAKMKILDTLYDLNLEYVDFFGLRLIML